MVNWGILGTSFISEKIAEAIKLSDSGVICAVAGRSSAKLTTFSEKFQIPHQYIDYDELLRDPEVHAVYIGLPTYLHSEWVIKCATAGKHVLCEKSFAINAKETIAAFQAVKENKIFCMEAQMHRCHQIIPKLKEIILLLPLGKIHTIKAVFNAPIINLFNRVAGGSILDLGCYPISLIRYIFGEISLEDCHAELIPPRNLSESYFDVYSNATFIVGNEIRGFVETSNNSPLHWEFTVSCENGEIQLSNIWDNKHDDTISIIRNNQEPEVIIINQTHNFYVSQMNIVNYHILQGDFEAKCTSHSAPLNWEDTILNMQTLDNWRSKIGLHYSNEAYNDT